MNFLELDIHPMFKKIFIVIFVSAPFALKAKVSELTECSWRYADAHTKVVIVHQKSDLQKKSSAFIKNLEAKDPNLGLLLLVHKTYDKPSTSLKKRADIIHDSKGGEIDEAIPVVQGNAKSLILMGGECDLCLLASTARSLFELIQETEFKQYNKNHQPLEIFIVADLSYRETSHGKNLLSDFIYLNGKNKNAIQTLEEMKLMMEESEPSRDSNALAKIKQWAQEKVKTPAGIQSAIQEFIKTGLTEKIQLEVENLIAHYNANVGDKPLEFIWNNTVISTGKKWQALEIKDKKSGVTIGRLNIVRSEDLLAFIP